MNGSKTHNKKERPLVIAGPCSAESREQVLETAKEIASINSVSIFRAGAWKPRTQPGHFEGAGAKALTWLEEVKNSFPLKVATEVALPQHVELALKSNIDVLWIGARTSVSPFAMDEIGAALKGVDIPVFVKNPIHADLKLWKGAMERLMRQDLKQLGLIHRGFNTHKHHRYRNSPHWQLPLEMKRSYPELPLLCDPSHIAGNRDFIEGVCGSALNLGLDGLMVETHYQPQQALSDSAQQVTPSQLANILNSVFTDSKRSELAAKDPLLESRLTIDEIDREVLELLEYRSELSAVVSKIKREHGLELFQESRFQQILNDRVAQLKDSKLSESFIRELFSLIHSESILIQKSQTK